MGQKTFILGINTVLFGTNEIILGTYTFLSVNLFCHNSKLFWVPILVGGGSVVKRASPQLTDPEQTGLFNIHLCNYLDESPFSSKSSSNLQSQTIKARDLKFLVDVHLSPPFIWQVSGVRCLFMYYFFIYFFFLAKSCSQLVEGLLPTGPTPSSFYLLVEIGLTLRLYPAYIW